VHIGDAYVTDIVFTILFFSRNFFPRELLRTSFYREPETIRSCENLFPLPYLSAWQNKQYEIIVLILFFSGHNIRSFPGVNDKNKDVEKK